MAEKEKKSEARFELAEIPTEMGIVCRDNKTEGNLSQFELLIQVANDIKQIKKGIVGEK